jgi:transcriptional regulator with XRE-family HTH domain
MASLDEYLSKSRGRQTQLARQLGLGAGTLSGIRSGVRRPSTDLAKRIEAATGGEVRATDLLGLQEDGASFRHSSPPRPLGGGRWGATVGSDGTLLLTTESIAALGFSPGERLVFRRERDGVKLSSADRALEAFQDYLEKVGHRSGSLVDELIAERRAEAANE